MAKKAFPRDFDADAQDGPDFSQLDPGLDSGGDIKSKGRVFAERVASVIKFIFGLILLVVVYAGTRAFLDEFGAMDKTIKAYFWWGVLGFVLFHFFVFEPAIVYQKGQKLLTFVFKFIAPLVKVAPFVLPIYTIILLCIYPLLMLLNSTRQDMVTLYCVFGLGLTMALHIVFSAKTLRSRQGDFLKANYIFGFSLIYVINLLLLGFALNLLFAEFSFLDFFAGMSKIAHGIYYAAVKQIFAL